MADLNKKLALALLACIMLLGCDLFPTPIGKILKDPRSYAGKEVTVSGEVVEVFSLVFIRYFIVQDTTGQIAVVTTKPLPIKGQKIKVRGKVQEAFAIADQQLIVIVED